MSYWASCHRLCVTLLVCLGIHAGAHPDIPCLVAPLSSDCNKATAHQTLSETFRQNQIGAKHHEVVGGFRASEYMLEGMRTMPKNEVCHGVEFKLPLIIEYVHKGHVKEGRSYPHLSSCGAS
jgi:hypothetical protein